ncbi:RB-associated KRAB zinc finger protein-like, partial [Clarias magur]
METLVKTAVLEISKLVELECKILLSEVSRGQHEITFLRKRLQLMEKHVATNSTTQNQDSGTVSTSVQEDSSRTENQSSRLANHTFTTLNSPRTENHSCRTGTFSSRTLNSSTTENHSSTAENHTYRTLNSSTTENHNLALEIHSSRSENQSHIKRESELEESSEDLPPLLNLPLTTEKDHAHTREKQHDCNLQQRHQRENQTSEVKIKQEGVWDAESRGETMRDGGNRHMVETMLSDSHFQSQLASIMEMLAKSAVLEIGKLVEESHAVFRREISRRISENQALKNNKNEYPLCWIEAGHRPTIDGVFGKEWCMELWRDKGSSAVQKHQDHADPCVIEDVDLMEDDGPDTIIIKDETFDDGPGKSKPQVNSSSEKDA